MARLHGLRQTGTCVLVMDFTYKIASAGQHKRFKFLSRLTPRNRPLTIVRSIACFFASEQAPGNDRGAMQRNCAIFPKEDMEPVAAGIVTTLKKLRECGCDARPRLKAVVLDGAGISAVKQAEGALMPAQRRVHSVSFHTNSQAVPLLVFFRLVGSARCGSLEGCPALRGQLTAGSCHERLLAGSPGRHTYVTSTAAPLGGGCLGKVHADLVEGRAVRVPRGEERHPEPDHSLFNNHAAPAFFQLWPALVPLSLKRAHWQPFSFSPLLSSTEPPSAVSIKKV